MSRNQGTDFSVKIELTTLEQASFDELLSLNGHLNKTHHFSLEQLVRLESRLGALIPNREWTQSLDTYRRLLNGLRLLPSTAIKPEQDFAAALQEAHKKSKL